VITFSSHCSWWTAWQTVSKSDSEQTMGFLKSAVNSYKGRKDRLQEKMLIKIFIKTVVPNGNGRASWLNTIRAEKEEAQEV
jgi:hypothetical protein